MKQSVSILANTFFCSLKVLLAYGRYNFRFNKPAIVGAAFLTPHWGGYNKYNNVVVVVFVVDVQTWNNKIMKMMMTTMMKCNKQSLTKKQSKQQNITRKRNEQKWKSN